MASESPRGFTPEERHRLLVEWNDTTADYPDDRCVHELFEAQVERTPTAVAVAFGAQELTYGQLNARANQLAHMLREKGVGPDRLVGLSVERSLEMVVGLLAILKAGGAYVPLDPTHPPKRRTRLVEDSGVMLVLTQEHAQGGPLEVSADVLYLDGEEPALACAPTDNVSTRVDAENLAYVIYTSGSTGSPKGVAVRHRSLANLHAWFGRTFALGAGDAVLQSTALTADASCDEIFQALLSGAKLVLARPSGSGDPDYLIDTIQKHHVRMINIVPSMLRVLLQHAGFAACTSLRDVISGGEALPADLANQFHQQLGARLHNLYGPTETTVDATAYVCRPKEEGSTVPIGRPIDNARVYVLDGVGQPMPMGAVGELYVGGIGLARGYHRRPDLTAERFVPDPFGESGGRLYRTGDLVRWRRDGIIEFVGRADHQVQLRGYRVELGEIETVLREHPAVLDAVVSAVDDGAGRHRLVGYVVGQPGEADLPVKEWENEQVGQWQRLYEESYAREDAQDDPRINFAGWNNSRTGEPIPADEMRVWLEATVERIVATEPRRVLEIGCGNGLVLFQLAPRCERYLGTDFSEQAVSYVSRYRERLLPSSLDLMLESRLADDFRGIEARAHDTVILNSVVQYFPSVDYLLRVLRGAVDATADGGTVFVGDVRNFDLLAAFHAFVERYRTVGDLPLSAVRARVQQQMAQESELLIAPSFFLALAQELPRISHVEIAPKRGRAHNELTKFRYDVTLHVGASAPAPHPIEWLDWRDGGQSLASIESRLSEDAPAVVGIRGVPNARTLADALAWSRFRAADEASKVSELNDEVDREAATDGVDPEDVWSLEAKSPYTVRLSWAPATEDGRFDVLFARRDVTEAVRAPMPAHRARPWASYANTPLRGRLNRALVQQLKSFLEERLPDYMVPSAFVALESLPLSPNGKVDRRALPDPGFHRSHLDSDYVAPRTPLDSELVDIWRRVLSVPEIGIRDSFWDLGGDSILAAVVANEIQDRIGEVFHVAAIFDAPTVAELAAYLNEHYRDAAALLRRDVRAATVDPDGVAVAPVIDSARVDQLRRLVTPLAPLDREETTDRNPSAIFVLAPPRSGSSLLRIMLGGHPSLFAPPELELLSFNTLQDRRAACSGGLAFMREGTIRAMMELRGCAAEEAERFMADCEERGLTVKQFYRLLQESIGDRTLVDKTTDYALDVDVLQRAEQYFEGAKYVYLLRHPCGMIRSFEEARLDLVLPFRHPFSAREMGELLWCLCYDNIERFLQAVPAERQHRLQFEDLVRTPEVAMGEVCEFLGLEQHADMVDPYRHLEGRMTDGLYEVSRPLSDPKFLAHRRIDPGVADLWKGRVDPASLGAMTRELAGSLGYELGEKIALQPIRRVRPPTSAIDVERLTDAEVEAALAWLLEQQERDGR